jgi:hypothetical protein
MGNGFLTLPRFPTLKKLVPMNRISLSRTCNGEFVKNGVLGFEELSVTEEGE